MVDADDSRVAAIVEALAPDWLQLHGAESPERVAALRAAFGRPILKALGIAEQIRSFARGSIYEAVADQLLFDAKPPKGAALPGGNGLSFDWTILQDYSGRARERTGCCRAGLTATMSPRRSA